MVKTHLLKSTHRGDSNVYPQHMLLKIRKTTILFGKLHFPSIMSIVMTSFKHPKLPISIKISVTLLQIVYILHYSYISKFEFMSNLFAKLLAAWL